MKRRFAKSEFSCLRNGATGLGTKTRSIQSRFEICYVINELQSTVSTYAFDGEKGVLELRRTISTLPAGFEGENTGAEVQMGPSGKFVYVSNRGHDSIGVFSVSPLDGTLIPVQDVSTGGKRLGTSCSTLPESSCLWGIKTQIRSSYSGLSWKQAD